MINWTTDVQYYKKCIEFLPCQYLGADTNRYLARLLLRLMKRMTLAYFCISALDLLNELSNLTIERKQSWIEWVYAQLLERIDSSSDGSLVFI